MKPKLRQAFVFATALLMAAVPLPAQVAVERGVVYQQANGIEVRLDIAYPTQGTGPRPAVIFAFGGGWGYFAKQNRSQFFDHMIATAEKGYVAATVDYRVTSEKVNGVPVSSFPDPVHDLKQAVRWLRVNADRYGIDPGHIGAVGFSSGAHLVLMLAVTDENDGLEGRSADAGVSSRVQAAVAMGGPGDMAGLYRETAAAPQRVVDLLGGTPEQVPERYALASPVNYVSADDPPVMLVHGDRDTKIPTAQALQLDAEMTRQGHRHLLVIKKDAGHKKFPMDDEIWAFFQEHLH
jgi:acetyl esterase/lipase